MRPLLSICIPTWNRAALLEHALDSWCRELKACGAEAELIVCDNASPDGTPDVVRRAQEVAPVRYYRNATNIGGIRNVLRLAYELAEGEYTWILGDDDIVLPGGLRRVLDALRANPGVDFVYVNVSPKHSRERGRFRLGTPAGTPTGPFPLRDLLPTRCADLGDHPIGRWENLIDPEVDEVFLGGLMCAVFRTSLWRSYRLRSRGSLVDFPTLADTYPHCVNWANTLVGHQAYYVGHPSVIAFWGEQMWMDLHPLVVLVRLQDLLDLYLAKGVPASQVAKCRRSLLGISLPALIKMVSDRRSSGRRHFSLGRFLWRNRGEPRALARLLARMAWAMIRQYGRSELTAPAFALVSGTLAGLRKWRRGRNESVSSVGGPAGGNGEGLMTGHRLDASPARAG